MAPRSNLTPEVTRDTLLPTPPVGFLVGWLDRGKEDACYAAVVTKIEGPGRIELHIFPPRTQFTVLAHYRNGVYFQAHPMHTDNPHNINLVRNGCWKYLPDVRIPDSHYALHRAEIERRDAARQKAAAAQEASAAAMRARTMVPDDLPTPVPLS